MHNLEIGQLYKLRYEMSINGIEPLALNALLKTKGQILGVLSEPWISGQFSNLAKNKDSQGSYDFNMSGPNLVIEHKIMNGKGVASLLPSYMKGIGRKFDRDRFEAFIKSIDGYLITCIEDVPDMLVGFIPTAVLVAHNFPKEIRRKNFEGMVHAGLTKASGNRSNC